MILRYALSRLVLWVLAGVLLFPIWCGCQALIVATDFLAFEALMPVYRWVGWLLATLSAGCLYTMADVARWGGD